MLSLGLCIDFCTHIAHAHWAAAGAPSERAATALGARGTAVLNVRVRVRVRDWVRVWVRVRDRIRVRVMLTLTLTLTLTRCSTPG